MHRMIVGDMDDAGSEGLPQNPGAKTGQSVGIMGHEKLGAEYLRRLGFSSKVCNLVESHVVAKRYLTAIDQKYYESLSNASKLSLKFQGGPFSPEDAAAFETDPLFKEKVQLRKWDDASKVVDLQTPGLDAYRAMAIKHLGRRI
ncbi:hypothetical protein LPJ81_005028 [Coemansia sp. IMI 209127]|nr:hypothetical protein LPJ81_005028 [Coemansia sp. IMI 209127]